jgi:nicotinamide mononucleotide (NMN) deamidase PncC
MLASWRRLIERIHETPVGAVLATTGGGASAIADLLVVPGGSRTVLEAVVPYSPASLAAWLGRAPEQACTEQTALAMAAVACQRAERLAPSEGESATADRRSERTSVGVACTAALVSRVPKKGAHRCHVAVQTPHGTLSAALVLEKGARTRDEEEALVGRVLLSSMARGIGLEGIPPIELRPGERIVERYLEAPPLLRELRDGSRALVWSLPDGGLTATLAGAASPPIGILCGSFNPLHDGHRRLRAAAESLLGGGVYYELSIRNVDKPPLDFLTIDSRRRQFVDSPLALTAVGTFVEKARVLPGVTFVVGVDTAERIVAPKYYSGSEESMTRALAGIRDFGCRFLVAGRKQCERFMTLGDLSLPRESADLFEELPARVFRADISATEIRRQSQPAEE